ncbi:hypothetical protein ACE38V_22095 [Cytobacillus sp. Hz8]
MRSHCTGITGNSLEFSIQPEKTDKMAVVAFENNLLVSEDGGKEWKKGN